METIYLCIVIFLLCLAVFDLFVGVSNDAVNFLQSAVGARVASFRTILIIASVGVMLGAVMSSGMMDVARHGIMMPAHYSFHEVMTIMLAVMVTDIIVLDAFNTLGMPTSTTVSLVFELLGGAVAAALIKISTSDILLSQLGDFINSQKALAIVSGIVCDGAKASCAAKIASSVDAALLGYNMYKCNQEFKGGDGIVMKDIETTIKGIGRLGKDGMKETNEEIIRLMIE